MNISGVRPNSDFYQYNAIKLNELRSRQISQARQMEERNKAQEQEEQEPKVAVAEATAEPKYDSYDYAQLYRSDESYSLKGIESDLGTLDLEKAITSLEKDNLLQQYQYFVGDKGNDFFIPQLDEPAPLRSGENFVL